MCECRSHILASGLLRSCGLSHHARSSIARNKTNIRAFCMLRPLNCQKIASCPVLMMSQRCGALTCTGCMEQISRLEFRARALASILWALYPRSTTGQPIYISEMRTSNDRADTIDWPSDTYLKQTPKLQHASGVHITKGSPRRERAILLHHVFLANLRCWSFAKLSIGIPQRSKTPYLLRLE